MGLFSKNKCRLGIPKVTHAPTLDSWLKDMDACGHKVYANDARPYNLNITGFRTSKPELDKFEDWITVAWKFEGEWSFKAFQATTLPGNHWLRNRLLNPKGTAILVPGQYEGVYRLALHGGRYEALCQRGGPVTVYRDGNRDKEFDYEPSTKMSGMFGINIHRANRSGVTGTVNKHSAGCQVFQDAKDFEEVMRLCNKSALIYGNSFTYTLIQR